MKVSELKKKLDVMNPDEEIAATFITGSDVKTIAKEQNRALTEDDVRGVISSIENMNDNWDDVIVQSIISYFERG